MNTKLVGREGTGHAALGAGGHHEQVGYWLHDHIPQKKENIDLQL